MIEAGLGPVVADESSTVGLDDIDHFGNKSNTLGIFGFHHGSALKLRPWRNNESLSIGVEDENVFAPVVAHGPNGLCRRSECFRPADVASGGALRVISKNAVSGFGDTARLGSAIIHHRVMDEIQ